MTQFESAVLKDLIEELTEWANKVNANIVSLQKRLDCLEAKVEASEKGE